MAYTPENNPYIPGDPYSYDLKWQVDNIKHLQTRFGELDEQVQEATDQADRATQEADRAAGRADFATDEADRATEEADRATDEADRATEEADRATDEADRSKSYADNIADPVSGLVTEWLEENITQPTTPAIDTSLTVAGAAADAAAAGYVRDVVNSEFDRSTVSFTTVADRAVGTDGNYITSDVWNVTQPIALDDARMYFYRGYEHLSSSGTIKIGFYNSINTSAATCTGVIDMQSGMHELVIPAGSTYVVFSIHDDDLSNVVIENYADYSAYAEQIAAVKNTADNNSAFLDGAFDRSTVSFTTVADRAVGTDGNYIISNVWNVTQPIALDDARMYFYRGYEHLSSSGTIKIGFYNSINTSAATCTGVIDMQSGMHELVIPAGSTYVVFSIHDDDLSNVVIENYADMQAEISSIKTSNPNYDISMYKASECSLDNLAWGFWMYPDVVIDTVRRNRAYFGCVTQGGLASVGSVDLDNRSVKQTWLWNAGADDHNGMAVFYHAAKARMFAFSTTHNNDNFIREYYSAHTYSADFWEPEVKIEFADRVTYAQVFYAPTIDRIVIFTRFNVNSWYIKISNNSFGNSWGGAGVNEYPVVTTSNLQYYCMFRKTNNAERLRIVMYSNPNWTPNDTNIRMGFLDLITGDIYNADNTTVLGSIYTGGVDYSRFDIIVPTETGKRNRLLDVVEGSTPDRTFIAYATFTDETDPEYKVYYNGITANVAPAGTPFYTPSIYVGGVKFNTLDKDIIYVSRMDQNNQDHIEKYIYSNGAYVYNATLATSTHRAVDNRTVRPIIDSSAKILLYLRGLADLNNFSNYRFDADYVIL